MRNVASYMAERALAVNPTTATAASPCAATDVGERCSLGHDDRADGTKFWVDISAKYPIEPRTELNIGTMSASGSSGLGRLPLALLAHFAMPICCAGICPKFWPIQKAINWDTTITYCNTHPLEAMNHAECWKRTDWSTRRWSNKQRPNGRRYTPAVAESQSKMNEEFAFAGP